MKHPEHYFFWGIVALAATLRFATLGDRPFDGDEGVILKIAELPIWELLQAVAVDVHPPLYHLLVHGSITLFGVSEWSVRFVGVLAGIGLVALYPLLGSTLRVPGWIFGLLLATSPYLVNLSQDARMYSLLVFLAVALWIVTYRLGTDRADQSRLGRAQTGPWSWWLGWTALALGIVYTHHIGWLIVGLMGMMLLWETTKNPPQSPFAKGEERTPLFRKEGLGEILKRASVAIAILALGYFPSLPTTIAQVQGRLGEQSLDSGLGDTMSGVGGGLYRMLAGRTFLDINPSGLADLAGTNPFAAAAFAFTLIVPILLLFVGFRHLRGNTPGVLEDGLPTTNWRPQTLAIIIASFVLALTIGTIGTQASRYLSYLAPFILGFLALGCVSVWKSSWPARIATPAAKAAARLSGWRSVSGGGKAAVLVVALTFLAGLTTQYVRHNQSAGVDVYAQAIKAELAAGDAVLLRGGFAGGEKRAFRYYLDRIRSTSEESVVRDQHLAGEPNSLPIVDMFADYDVRTSNLDELRSVDPAQKAAELLSQPDITRVWYFDNTYQEPTLQNLPEGLTSEVVPLYATDKEGKQLILTKVTRKAQ